jgi:hypothetical protein
MPYYESAEELKTHLREKHRGLTDKDALENLICSSTRNRTPVHPAAWCPVCYAPVRSQPGFLHRACEKLAQQFPAHLEEHVNELLEKAMQGVVDLKTMMKESDAVSELMAKRSSLTENGGGPSEVSAQKRRRLE